MHPYRVIERIRIYFAAMITRVRELENIHIYLWLFKDICWMLTYKTAGLVVAVPTFGLALFLAVITVRYERLFVPNLAVLCWISANIVWMCGEFFGFAFAPVSLTLFVLGLIVISYYFLKFYKWPWRPTE